VYDEQVRVPLVERPGVSPRTPIPVELTDDAAALSLAG
jgi:hypothetical protein